MKKSRLAQTMCALVEARQANFGYRVGGESVQNVCVSLRLHNRELCYGDIHNTNGTWRRARGGLHGGQENPVTVVQNGSHSFTDSSTGSDPAHQGCHTPLLCCSHHPTALTWPGTPLPSPAPPRAAPRPPYAPPIFIAVYYTGQGLCSATETYALLKHRAARAAAGERIIVVNSHTLTLVHCIVHHEAPAGQNNSNNPTPEPTLPTA